MAKEELPYFDCNDPVQFKRMVGYAQSFEGKGLFKCSITKVHSYETEKQRGYYWSEILPCGAYRVRQLWGEEDFDSFKMHEFFKDRFLKVYVMDKLHENGGEPEGSYVRSTMSLDTNEFRI